MVPKARQAVKASRGVKSASAQERGKTVSLKALTADEERLAVSCCASRAKSGQPTWIAVVLASTGNAGVASVGWMSR